MDKKYINLEGKIITESQALMLDFYRIQYWENNRIQKGETIDKGEVVGRSFSLNNLSEANEYIALYPNVYFAFYYDYIEENDHIFYKTKGYFDDSFDPKTWNRVDNLLGQNVFSEIIDANGISQGVGKSFVNQTPIDLKGTSWGGEEILTFGYNLVTGEVDDQFVCPYFGLEDDMLYISRNEIYFAQIDDVFKWDEQTYYHNAYPALPPPGQITSVAIQMDANEE